MELIKVFTPTELNLTKDEERALAVDCGGNADNCFARVLVDEGMTEREEGPIWYSINKKLLKAECKDGERVFIDCCW